MPFDGSEYRFAPLAPAAPEAPGVWDRVKAAFARLGGATVWSFAPGDPVVPSEVTAVHMLRSARALIELEDRWVQGRYETVRGRRCAMGALQAAARVLRDPRAFEEAKDLLGAEAVLRGYTHVEKIHDRSSHSQVLAAFDAAISKAEMRISY
jgi:hypothetical protein